MGSPELTKMADFVGAGRVPEIDGAMAPCRQASGEDHARPCLRAGITMTGESRSPRL
jgi:hypothetical protein